MSMARHRIHFILSFVSRCLLCFGQSARRRADREVGEIKAVLDKCARTDVQQDESLLTRMEREILKDWREREQKLTVLEGRVEELVFILRDLAVYGRSDD